MSESGKVVKLNVGGFEYSTSIETLRKDPSNMLYEMFDDKWVKNNSNTTEQTFIDRDGRLYFNTF